MIALAIFAVIHQQVDTKSWKTFASRDGSFSIKAPTGWTKGDLSDRGTKKALAKLKERNPKLAEMFDNADQRHLDLYLVDFDSADGETLDNLNLKITKNSGLTTGNYAEIAKTIGMNPSMSDIGTKITYLPAGSTLSYWGSFAINYDDGHQVKLTSFGYLIIKNGNTYICTVTTSLDKGKASRKVFDAMAETISIR